MVWHDAFRETVDEPVECSGKRNINKEKTEAMINAFRVAAEGFLGKSVLDENVAYHKVSIGIDSGQTAKTTGTNGSLNKKSKNNKRKANKSNGPYLDVTIIVHSTDETTSDDCENTHFGDKENPALEAEDAELILVRMVNKVPLLDSTEALACGLVQGLVTKKNIWSSFGLDVSLKPYSPASLLSSCSPTYIVRDTDQVASFLGKGKHDLLATGSDGVTADSRELLPARVRLGKILVVIGIHADPGMLPLPTLSKVRNFLLS